jgi:hypothetical protein
LENAPTWYHHVNNGQGFDIGLNSLYLITGCDKAEAWALAAHSDTNGETSISLNLSVPSVVQGGASYSYRWEKHQSVQGRVSSNTLGVKNQCVFARGFRISVSENKSLPLSPSVKVENGEEKFESRPKFKTKATEGHSQGSSGGFLLNAAQLHQTIKTEIP